MKFKTGDKIQKIKGYRFEGVIIGGGTKLDGERILYMVEVELGQNCGGMVHIFAEQDIELYGTNNSGN